MNAKPALSADMAASTREIFDVVVVGGGINGAGIARDLAGRGLSVLMCEKDDLAQHTSSNSSKLIHGGLRYLEYGEFNLVRKALREREVLLRCAPHIMRPLRFVMPHNPAMRPAWLIRTGLYLYDHLAPRTVLADSAAVDLRHDPAGEALSADCVRGFSYYDVQVDDARLVVLNARDAADRGARILVRTPCARADRGTHEWSLQLALPDGTRTWVQARMLVNACGPWADSFLRDCAPGVDVRRNLRLVRGSHIVVRREYAYDGAFIFQNSDRRILFVLPWEDDFTLIGTTDVEHQQSPDRVEPTDAEVHYLCAQASRYLRQPVTAADVVWRFAGVRPLLDDHARNPASVTRDYLLEEDHSAAPLLSVWGGKLTTFRKLAEEACERIIKRLGRGGPAWTADTPLPGGDLSQWTKPGDNPRRTFIDFVSALQAHYPALDPALVRRAARCYGSRATRWMGDAMSMNDLGAEIVPGLREAELRYLVTQEWARSADDVLWRRTRLGLHLPQYLRGEARLRIDAAMDALHSSPSH